MTAPKTATRRGLDPHWKVHIVVGGALLHIASWTEPIWHDQHVGPWLEWKPIMDDHEYGDTLGFIEWGDVVAVTWRYAP